jgi:hypothetical protein
MTLDDRAKLRRLLASFDEAGLVALANKGLVRRAQKDLERASLTIEETDTVILVRGPDWTVTMPPDGPVHATDTTKATGVTRQILSATIWLRDHWSPPGEPGLSSPGSTPSADVEPLRQALLSITKDDLQKWAGKNILREMLTVVQAAPTVEVETHAGLMIRLTAHGVEARLLPGKPPKSPARLLDQILTTAPKAQHSRWVVAAVLALQQSCGYKHELPQAVPAEVAGAVLSRPQVLHAAHELLESMVATGLAHPSRRQLERLFTLSISASAVQLPRLARLLRALSNDVDQLLSRHAAADTSRLFDRLAFTFALSRALDAAGTQPPRTLAGQHRTEYDAVGELRLAGVGAYPWQTPSGFEGVTVLFWDLCGKRFLTWTASRPAGGPGRFDRVHTYRHEAIWSGGGPPARLSRSCFTLKNARVNARGRLSASQQTTVADVTPCDPAALDLGDQLVSDWPAVFARAVASYPIGLIEKDPLDRVAVLKPATWGERVFDEMQQRIVWQLHDAAGNTLPLTLPWAGVHEQAIEFLERLTPSRDKLTGVVVRIGILGTGLAIEPLALWCAATPKGDHVLNPAFDAALIVSRQSGLLERLRQKYGRDRIATTLSEEEEGEMAAPSAGLPAGLETRLAEVESALLRLAEAGCRRIDEAMGTRLEQMAKKLEHAGLTELGAALAVFDRGAAAATLWAGYLCRLHRQAMTVQLNAPGVGAPAAL